MSRRIRLTPKQAASIASAELGRRVPPSTVRTWKDRRQLAGGPGWVDGEDLVRLLDDQRRRITRRPPR
jgi:hypothetical protein